MDLHTLILKLKESNDFFLNFTEAEVGELLKCCKPKTIEDRDLIFKEDSYGSLFYIIVHGSVLVKKKGKTVDIVREGECLGEMGALTGLIRTATAEAIKKVTLLEIDNSSIEQLSLPIQVKLFKNITLLISNRLRKRLEHIH